MSFEQLLPLLNRLDRPKQKRRYFFFSFFALIFSLRVVSSANPQNYLAEVRFCRPDWKVCSAHGRSSVRSSSDARAKL